MQGHLMMVPYVQELLRSNLDQSLPCTTISPRRFNTSLRRQLSDDSCVKRFRDKSRTATNNGMTKQSTLAENRSLRMSKITRWSNDRK